MLHSVNELAGYTVECIDGDIGRVEELYFDEVTWTVRYLVVDTGSLPGGRSVLVSPILVQQMRADSRSVVAEITRDQLERSPGVECTKPISRQYETGYFDYYGLPYYWRGPMLWGYSDYPATHLSPPARTVNEEGQSERARADPHLRSSAQVNGYAIQATGGLVGYAGDFLFDDLDWAIQYIVVDTGNRLPGKKILISPRSIERVDWSGARLYVGIALDSIRRSPEYSPTVPGGDGSNGGIERYYTRARGFYWLP